MSSESDVELEWSAFRCHRVGWANKLTFASSTNAKVQIEGVLGEGNGQAGDVGGGDRGGRVGGGRRRGLQREGCRHIIQSQVEVK